MSNKVPTKQIVSSVCRSFFRNLDTPPADAVLVPINRIYKSEDEPDSYDMSVIYKVDYCGEKWHTVYVRVTFKGHTIVKWAVI